VDDYLVGTADASTTTTSIKDDSLTPFNDDHFNGWEACGYALTNTPTAIITDFVKSTGVATLASAITGMASGVGYELHDFGHGKWMKFQYDSAINQAINYLALITLIDKADVTLAIAASTYEYVIPSGFVAISDIYEETSTADLYEAKPIQRSLWTISNKLVTSVVTPIIIFDRDNWSGTTGHNLRVVGQAKQGELSVETGASADTCLLNPAIVLAFAKANLYISKGMLAEGNALFQLAERQLFAQPRSHIKSGARRIVV